MNPPTLNDLCHRAEALAQDLRTLRENEKPEKWAKEKAAHARGEPVQFNLPHVWNEEIWEDWLGRAAPDFERTDMKWRIKPDPEWTPKFKVGDRVMEIEDRACHVWTVEKIQCPGYFLHKPEIHGGYSSCWRSDEQLRAAPWTLSRHIPGFRPLEEGEQWHREDGWTEEILSDGYRPLLRGEAIQEGDELLCEERWVPQQVHGRPVEFSDWMDRARIRTRRPLPDTERERFERAYGIAAPATTWSKHEKEAAWEIWQLARKAQ